jgi:preprotein translocase SecE subunit
VSDVASEARKQTSKKATRLGGGGLRIYKPGQGFYTRVGTAVGIGVLAVAGAFYLFSELERVVDPNTSYALPLRYGIAVGFLLVMGLVTYWIVGLGVRTNDFFIATEGEMKKVSWSTWPEVARSTKVVIVSVVLLGVFLFAVDLVFMAFFNWIGVLRGLSVSELVFGPGT